MEPEVQRVQAAQRRGARKAVERFATFLQGEGSRLAPVEEGTLRASGSVVMVEDLNAVEGWVIFSTPYAAVQHERTDFVHPLGGQAKYLEQPLNENLQRLEPLVQAAIAAEL